MLKNIAVSLSTAFSATLAEKELHQKILNSIAVY